MAKIVVLSCVEGHPYYQSDFVRYNVYLDEERVRNCLIADVKKGEVVIENTMIEAVVGRPLPTRTLRGKVEIVDRIN